MGGFVNLFGECGLSVGWILQGESCKSFEMWWPGRELNPRRQPFQGCALPLSYLAVEIFRKGILHTSGGK